MRTVKKSAFFPGIAAAILLLLLSGGAPVQTANAQTADELLAKIQELLAQINDIKARLAQVQAGPAAFCHDFALNLGEGGAYAKNDEALAEIKALYTALEKEGLAVSSDEKANYDFGEGTASAVSGFQQKYASEVLAPIGLKFPTGFVGPRTRAKLNELYGCGKTPAVSPQPAAPAPAPTQPTSPASTPTTLRGDADGDGKVDSADITYLTNYLYSGGPAPKGDGDANGDGIITVADIDYLKGKLGITSPTPVSPASTPVCGLALSCPAPAAAPAKKQIVVSAIASSDQSAVMGAKGISLASFSFSAEASETVKLVGVKITDFATVEAFNNLSLLDEYNTLLAATAASAAHPSFGEYVYTFNFASPPIVAPGMPRTLTLKGDAVPYAVNPSADGSRHKFGIKGSADTTAIGTVSNALVPVEGLFPVSGGAVTVSRGAPASTTLPDLVIDDIYYESPYIKVKYRNAGGAGSGDFLISLSTSLGSFPGNSYYRFPVPGAGESAVSGGFTPGLVGLQPGMTLPVTAVIDWEGRVTESNKNNNSLTKNIAIPAPSITVTWPTNGLVLIPGAQYQIRWTADGVSASTVNVYLGHIGGDVVTNLLLANVPTGSGSWAWTAPATAGSYWITVQTPDYSVYGKSNFIIGAPPPLTVRSSSQTPPAGYVYAGALNIPIFPFEVWNSSWEDVKVTNVTVNESVSPLTAHPQLTNLTLWDVSANSKVADSVLYAGTTAGAYSATFYLPTPSVVPAGAYRTYYVRGDVVQYQADPSILGTSGVFSVPTMGVTAIGASSNFKADQSGSAVGNTMTVAKAVGATQNQQPVALNPAPLQKAGLANVLSSLEEALMKISESLKNL